MIRWKVKKNSFLLKIVPKSFGKIIKLGSSSARTAILCVSPGATVTSLCFLKPKTQSNMWEELYNFHKAVYDATITS